MTETMAERIYRAAVNAPGSIPHRLQYRCSEHRCLLLDVIPLPDGNAVLHQARFKQSPDVNARRSNEAGRRANTYDGDRHWHSRTYLLTQSALSLNGPTVAVGEGLSSGAKVEPNQPLWCDHVLEYCLSSSDFRDDLAAGHAEVRVRPNGSRFTR